MISVWEGIKNQLIIVIQILCFFMKRKPSHQLFSQECNPKQVLRKGKSPLYKKHRPKLDNESLSFLAPQRPRPNKQKQQHKGDSNNSTANCTVSRSRLPRSKKSKETSRQGLSKEEIMEIINGFAIKIQRQWRVKIMRVRLKRLVEGVRKSRQGDEKRSKEVELKKRQLSYFTQNGEDIISSYNLRKYQSYSSASDVYQGQSQNNLPSSARSNTNSDNVSIKIPKDESEHDINTSLARKQTKQQKFPTQQKIVSKSNISEKQDRRVSYDSCLPKKSLLQNRRHSTGDLLFGAREIKKFQINKAYEIIIQQPKEELMIKPPIKSPAKRGEDEMYNIKYPFDKELKRRRKEIELSKRRKLLSIQNRFKSKEVTEGSYFQQIRKINEEHNSKLQYFRQKQGKIRSNWNELMSLTQANNRLQTKYLQDDHNNTSNIDVSLSFDKWDFNSSAKKSIENLPEFNQHLHNSRNYSFESVLRYLEDEDEGEQKNFRKVKSIKAVEAIAQRSKQMSEKEFDEALDVQLQKPLSKQQKPAEMVIREPVVDLPISERDCIKEHQLSDSDLTMQLQGKKSTINQKNNDKPFHQNHQHSIQIPKSEDPPENELKYKSQTKPQSQSLLISQIQAASPSENIFSDKQQYHSNEKTILRDLLFKDFSSGQKLIFGNQQTQNDNWKTTLKLFIELVNEKVVLNNIKVINSLKFMFAKMGEDRKQKKAKVIIKYPPIQADINAVNTWLLEISHFILDNYQNVIRDNLILVKQPPKEQLLSLARRNLSYQGAYQTIPQYVFKDFQFYYIKTLARNNGITSEKYDYFSTLLYTFHRCLVDSLNRVLMDQLVTGKNWITLPWSSSFHPKKKIHHQHAKSCLQRSINIVSNWGQYCLGRLQAEDDEFKQYDQQKLNVVGKQEILQLTLCSGYFQGNLLLRLGQAIFEDILMSACRELMA